MISPFEGLQRIYVSEGLDYLNSFIVQHPAMKQKPSWYGLYPMVVMCDKFLGLPFCRFCILVVTDLNGYPSLERRIY